MTIPSHSSFAFPSAVLLGLVLAAGVASGCTDDPQVASPVTGPDSGTASPDSMAPPQPDPLPRDDAGSDAASEASPDAGACHDLVNSAPVVTAKAVAAELPTGEGGAMTNGVYRLTDVTYYLQKEPPNPLTEKWQQTLNIENGNVSIVSRRGSGAEQRRSAKFVIADNKLTVEQSCPEPATDGPFEFTATANEIRLIAAEDERVYVFTLVE